MIKFILFISLIFPVCLQAQPATDTIVWSEQQLAWYNFKGDYDTAVYNRQYGATTFWRVRYSYRPAILQNKITFSVYAWFDARNSWVRPSDINNKSLLLHEQGHFDLAEILARQYRQQLSETTFSRAGYTDSIKIIFAKLLSGAYATQEKYDAETSHGMNSKRQAYWQTFITSELKKLEGFTDKNVTSEFVR